MLMHQAAAIFVTEGSCTFIAGASLITNLVSTECEASFKKYFPIKSAKKAKNNSQVWDGGAVQFSPQFSYEWRQPPTQGCFLATKGCCSPYVFDFNFMRNRYQPGQEGLHLDSFKMNYYGSCSWRFACFCNVTSRQRKFAGVGERSSWDEASDCATNTCRKECEEPTKQLGYQSVDLDNPENMGFFGGRSEGSYPPGCFVGKPEGFNFSNSPTFQVRSISVRHPDNKTMAVSKPGGGCDSAVGNIGKVDGESIPSARMSNGTPWLLLCSNRFSETFQGERKNVSHFIFIMSEPKEKRGSFTNVKEWTGHGCHSEINAVIRGQKSSAATVPTSCMESRSKKTFNLLANHKNIDGEHEHEKYEEGKNDPPIITIKVKNRIFTKQTSAVNGIQEAEDVVGKFRSKLLLTKQIDQYLVLETTQTTLTVELEEEGGLRGCRETFQIERKNVKLLTKRDDVFSTRLIERGADGKPHAAALGAVDVALVMLAAAAAGCVIVWSDCLTYISLNHHQCPRGLPFVAPTPLLGGECDIATAPLSRPIAMEIMKQFVLVPTVHASSTVTTSKELYGTNFFPSSFVYHYVNLKLTYNLFDCVYTFRCLVSLPFTFSLQCKQWRLD